MKKFEHLFEGMVWAVKADSNSAFIAIEIRHKDRKESEFYTMDMSNNSVVKIVHDFEEKWLWGMESIHYGVLILHHYKSSQSPEHQYIIAYDAKTGKKLWENYTDVFEKVQGRQVIVYSQLIEPRRLRSLDIYTGQASQAEEQSVETNFVYFPEYDLVLKQDVLERNGYRIASFLSDRSQVLEITHAEKNISIHDIISEDIEFLSVDSFFMFDHHLIFIKNKSQLVSYLLE